MQDMNWNYPTSIRFGLNRIKNIQEVCDELLIKNPLIVTDPGILQTDIIDKINSYLKTKAKVFSNLQAILQDKM